MSNSIVGFHTAGGGNKRGLGDLEEQLNIAGIPIFLKSTDEYGVLNEALNFGTKYGVSNWLVYRISEEASGGKVKNVPDYTKEYTQAAIEHIDAIIANLPPEFNKSKVWIDIINEPRAKNNSGDVTYNNMNAMDYLGEFSIAAAIYANSLGYKVVAPSLNSGEPEVFVTNEYEQDGMLKYLLYCSEYPNMAAIGLHEYNWYEESWDKVYPYLWGRLEAMFAACDKHLISRDFHVFITEWGFGRGSVPVWPLCVPFLDEYNTWAAKWPQVKGVASWTLQSGWDNISNKLQTWITPLIDYTKMSNFPEGEQPQKTHSLFGGTLPTDIPIDPPGNGGQAETIFHLDFTGVGIRDNPNDYQWIDDGAVQIPVYEGVPFTYVPAIGGNSFADGEPYNDFVAPEAVHKNENMLPPYDWKYLNAEDRTWHVHNNRAHWVDFRYPYTCDTDGTIELSMTVWPDYVKKVNGIKVPTDDPEHGRYELFIKQNGVLQGKRDWLIPVFSNNDPNSFEVSYPVKAGQAEVGFAILCVWSKSSDAAANGSFVETIEAIFYPDAPIEPPPVTGDVSQLIYGAGKDLQTVSLNAKAALQASMAKDNFSVTGSEGRVSVDGVKYAIQPSGIIDGSKKERVYYTEEGNWSNVRWVDEDSKDSEVPDYINVINLSQRDIRWANNVLGQPTGHNKTIGNWGCLLTVYDMWANHFGLTTRLPNEENNFYVGKAGFSGANLVSMAMSKVYTDVSDEGWLSVSRHGYDTMRNKTMDYLARGIPVPARVDFNPQTIPTEEQHWVLLVGYIEDVGFIMNDPWTGLKGVPVTDYYNIPGYDVLECIYYYITTEPVDPPPTGNYTYKGKAVTFAPSIHSPADDWRWPNTASMIASLGIGVKFMSNGINKDYVNSFNNKFKMTRMFWNNPNTDTKKDAYTLWNQDWQNDFRGMYNAGIRKFELHNEPNLYQEGFDHQWKNATEFGEWLLDMINLIRSSWGNNVELYFPGMSPGVPWTNQFAFTDIAWSMVKDKMDGFCLHAYVDNTLSVNNAIDNLYNQIVDAQEYLNLQVPMIISECSVNRGTNYEYKAQVYRGLESKLKAVPGIESVTWYVSDWFNPPPEQAGHGEAWFNTPLPEAYKNG